MTLARRMKLGFGALIAVMGIMIALNGAQLVWIKYWQGHASRTQQELGASSRMAVSVRSMNADLSALSEATARAYGKTEAREAFDAHSAAAANELESLLGSTGSDQSEAGAVEDIANLFAQYQRDGTSLFELAGSDPTNVATRIAPISRLGDQLLESVSAFQESRLSLGVAKFDRLGLMATVCLALQGVLGALAFFGGIIFAVLLTRKIIGTLKQAVSGISSSTSELLAVASQVAANSAQTAASTNETTATIEEVKQTAVLASERAGQVAEATGSVAEVSESGRSMVESTIASIEHMQGEMDVVSETINRLSERAQAVNDVIALVNDLAEQSNLLSVNASIEAAKAGEQGKGFTVVAQEVKSLAEQSKQAVSQVRTILGEIRAASDTAVQAVDRGRKAVERGREQSVESGQVIQTLATGVGDVAQAAAQISASSHQQLAGMEQIAQAVESINQAGAQSVEGTRQVEQEVKRLEDLSRVLKRLVQAETTG